MGDAAYTDDLKKLRQGYKDNSAPIEYVQDRFNKTLNDPYYKEMQRKTKVIGTWDDHDYGCNNGDKTFKKKQIMRELYLDFIGEPMGTDRRNENDTGIYQDYVVNYEDVKVHIILLDVRYDFDNSDNDRLGY